MITFNIKGGNGDATSGFNSNATNPEGSNTVGTRLKARWPWTYAIGLQEVCENNFNELGLYLAQQGMVFTPNGYHSAFVMSLNPSVGIGSVDPDSGCGAWYGNAIFMRGAFSSVAGGRYPGWVQAASSSGEQRAWLCVKNFITFCTSHLQHSGTSVTVAQQQLYRNVGNFNALDGTSTFMSGDFNLDWQDQDQRMPLYYDWYLSGWRDVDFHDPGMGVTFPRHSATLDYVWRTSPNTWSDDPYLGPASWTDHLLKQGYM